jgi:cyclic pyranopterin phosphate synthase
MNSNLIFQYYNLLKNNNFGLDLSLKALLNYINYSCCKLSDKIELSHTPPLVSMYITRRCNLNCNYCVVGKISDKYNYRDYELTQEKYYKILQHPLIKKALLINMCGGEPLLNENLIELINITKKQKKLVGLLTNGILLERKWDDLLKAKIDDIQVSIYDNTIDKFGNTLKIFNKDKRLNASYVLLKSDLNNNIEKIEKTIDFICESGFKSLKLNFCLSNKFNNFINELIDEKDSFKYEQLKNKILKKYKNIKIFFPKIYVLQKSIIKKCKMPWAILHVDAYGNYGFCCKHQPDVESNNNIFNNNWESIVNSEDFCKNRNLLLSNDNTIPDKCKDCYHLIGSYSSNI